MACYLSTPKDLNYIASAMKVSNQFDESFDPQLIVDDLLKLNVVALKKDNKDIDIDTFIVSLKADSSYQYSAIFKDHGSFRVSRLDLCAVRKIIDFYLYQVSGFKQYKSFAIIQMVENLKSWVDQWIMETLTEYNQAPWGFN